MRLAVHIAHGDLTLGVRAQKGQTTILAQLCLALDQSVRVVDGRRHQFGRFVAGVAKHQALIASAGVQMIIGGVVHTLGNIVALLVIGHQYRTTPVINAVVGVVVAYALQGVSRHLDVIHMGVGGDLTGQHHQTGVAQGLGGDAGFGVLREDGIENGIRDLIGHLVRVTFRDRLGSKEKIVRQGTSSQKKLTTISRCFGLEAFSERFSRIVKSDKAQWQFAANRPLCVALQVVP